MAKPTPAPSLSAEEWKLLRKELSPETAREISDLLVEHDPSTFDGFSRLSAKLGLMVATMRIHPSVASAAVRFFEMSFTSLLVGQDKHIGTKEEKNSVFMLIQQARETQRQIEDRQPAPLRIIESDEEGA